MGVPKSGITTLGGKTAQAAIEKCRTIRASLEKEVEQTLAPVRNRITAPAPGALIDYWGFTIVPA